MNIFSMCQLGGATAEKQDIQDQEASLEMKIARRTIISTDD